jgi:adenylosuccinate lyase
MSLSPLLAVSPLDGRYAAKTQALQDYCSEFALLKYRLIVEVRWLQHLAKTVEIAEVPALSATATKKLEALLANFSEEDALAIKQIEHSTNHDVKAVEYFLKQFCQQDDELSKVSEFIHFACTSEDINNLAYAMMSQAALQTVMLPQLQNLQQQLSQLAHAAAAIPMLARTHGQSASPTTFGKEMANFVARLKRQYQQLQHAQLSGKFSGAVGNFNAHLAAYPQVDWPSMAQAFVTSLGIEFNAYTTQIEPHDSLVELLNHLALSNTILIDLCRDVWGYISLGYCKQKVKSNEVGSSTMPHKVNPIDFENAEGNLGLSNALIHYLRSQLPTSRWQRDLVDSTVLRNLGSCFAYALVAYQAISKGLSKLDIDENKMQQDLDAHYEVLTEAIQTVMRRYGCEQPYERLKALSRGQAIDQAALVAFINDLEIPKHEKQRLCALTPSTYLGYADQLAKKI